MSTPRVAAIHDLSGFGRCSLTIVLPTLAAMGVQCRPLPTAYLSTHTGGFTGNTFLDLTDQMAPVTAHWQSLHLTFDAVYSGFMGSRRQIELTAAFLQAFRDGRCLAVVDPVMGDHGKAYRTYTTEMCRAMAKLAQQADVITPNRTEAALLLDVPYGELRLEDAADCRRWARALSLNGQRSVVLTGAEPAVGVVGAACYDRETGMSELVTARRIEGQYHGTGDLFASVLTGALVRGRRLAEAARQAAGFVSLCAQRTLQAGIPPREGVEFEPLLWQLGK